MAMRVVWVIVNVAALAWLATVIRDRHRSGSVLRDPEGRLIPVAAAAVSLLAIVAIGLLVQVVALAV